MIDNTKFDYTPLNTPNLLVRTVKNFAPVEMILHPFLEPLVWLVMKAQPSWKVVVESSNLNSDGLRRASAFRLYADNEELGELSVGLNNKRNHVFELDNHRLKASRQRGCMTTTVAQNKALKIILNDFAPRSMKEHLAEASKKISNAVSTAVSINTRPMREAISYLEKPLQQFAIDNWEAFCKTEGATSVPANKFFCLDTFIETYERGEAASGLGSQHCKKTGYYVVLQGSEYIVSRLDKQDEAQILTSDKLSEHMRVRIGLLKLVEDGQFIAGVGVRTNATMFYVVPEEIVSE